MDLKDFFEKHSNERYRGLVNPAFSLVDDCVYETDEDVISEFRSYLEPYNETRKGGALSELDLAEVPSFVFYLGQGNHPNEDGT